MTKSRLIKVIAQETRTDPHLSELIIETFISEIVRNLKRGEKVVLSGFGTFLLSRVADKEVVPFGREKERQVVKSHNAVTFRSGKPLKKVIN